MAQTLAPTFGDLLKQVRKRAGMTQGDLAAAVGYSVSFVSVLEQNPRLPDVDAVLQVFVPALGLQDEPHLATRLVELAANARGERLPVAITRQRETQIVVTEARGERSTHLPAAPTDLIGRAQEVRQLCQRLPGHSGRLLTLVGPPGIGKTQLALAVAAHLHYHYPDGAAFVALAAVSDAVVMAATIAASVGCSDASLKPPKTKLIEWLRNKTMLLVLDNLEQIRDGAPLIAELLAECPGLCVLATSRERLHLRAEQRFHVPPLDLAPAIELFVQRAQAVQADFRLTPQNQPTLAAICQRLDRLPLALELCAAQIDLLSPAQLLVQLQDRRLDLLVDGAHDLPPRQRTLRTAIQHSYRLLDEAERTLLRRLGIFVGGFDVPTLTAVVADSMAGAARPLTATLHALIGKSLVRAETTPSGEQRFVMLETIREYALERLEESGEFETMRRRHAEYFVALAEMVEPELNGPKLKMWLNRLDADYDNLHAVLAWSLRGQPDIGVAPGAALELGLRLAAAIWGFWTARNRQSEGRAWIESGLERSPSMAAALPLSVRVKAINTAGYMAVFQGDHARATALLEEGLALSREAEDHSGMASVLLQLGRLARRQGDYGRAERLEEESLALFRSRDDAWGTAHALTSLSDAALEQGAFDRATTYLQEALTITRDSGLAEWRIWATYNLARVAHLQGDYRQAMGQLEESLAQFRDLDYATGVAQTLLNLGRVTHAQGNNTMAAQHFIEGLALMRETPVSEIHDTAIEGLAGVAAAQGQPERAARLFGAAEALREVAGTPLPPAYRAAYERDVTAIRAQLDDDVFAAAWVAGRALPLEQAIAEALEESPINDRSRLDAKESSL